MWAIAKRCNTLGSSKVTFVRFVHNVTRLTSAVPSKKAILPSLRRICFKERTGNGVQDKTATGQGLSPLYTFSAMFSAVVSAVVPSLMSGI